MGTGEDGGDHWDVVTVNVFVGGLTMPLLLPILRSVNLPVILIVIDVD